MSDVQNAHVVGLGHGKEIDKWELPRQFPPHLNRDDIISRPVKMATPRTKFDQATGM